MNFLPDFKKNFFFYMEPILWPFKLVIFMFKKILLIDDIAGISIREFTEKRENINIYQFQTTKDIFSELLLKHYKRNLMAKQQEQENTSSELFEAFEVRNIKPLCVFNMGQVNYYLHIKKVS